MTPPTLPTTPMPTEVTAKPITPTKNARRRPNRSASFPPKISRDANASM